MLSIEAGVRRVKASRSRAGIWRIDVVACALAIGVAFVLLMMFLPHSLDRERRGQCSTNLKNLGLAAIQYESARGSFPGYCNDFGTFQPSTSLEYHGMVMPHRKIGTWAVSLLPWLDEQPTYETWTHDQFPVAMSSILEADFSQGRAGVGFSPEATPDLEIMQCRFNPHRGVSRGRNSYIANAGMHGSPAMSKAWMTAANGVFHNQFPGNHGGMPAAMGASVTMADFHDGHSMTVLFSESVQAMPWHRSGFLDAKDLLIPMPKESNRSASSESSRASISESSSESHNALLVGSEEVRFDPNAQYTQGMVWHDEDDAVAGKPVLPVHRINGTPADVALVDLVMSRANAADVARPSSRHHEGVNMVMADGATRFVSEEIDYRVYQALLTPAGRASDVPDPSFVLDVSLLSP